MAPLGEFWAIDRVSPSFQLQREDAPWLPSTSSISWFSSPSLQDLLACQPTSSAAPILHNVHQHFDRKQQKLAGVSFALDWQHASSSMSSLNDQLFRDFCRGLAYTTDGVQKKHLAAEFRSWMCPANYKIQRKKINMKNRVGFVRQLSDWIFKGMSIQIFNEKLQFL